MRDDRLYLLDIQERIQRIESYTQEGLDTFLESEMIQDAVIRNFEVIGEATKRLSQDFKQSHPQIQWQQIAGLRDVLIHDYVRVNLTRVWGIIEDYLPSFKGQIENLLSQLGEGL
ncbi:MAG: DUF86 domain-containing protein [Leptolyngbya sp.]|nr:MAG: DUF86 domain-containing protein [Leptolyngbya sp.]